MKATAMCAALLALHAMAQTPAANEAEHNHNARGALGAFAAARS
jgi:hypothetical protein